MIKYDEKIGKYYFQSSTGRKYSSANKGYIEYQFRRAYPNGVIGVNENVESETTPAAFTINERFEFITNYVVMVADKIQPSLIISGPGGLGKSFTVNKTLVEQNFVDVSNTESFEEGSHLPSNRFKVIKGYSTPKALYRLLYENRDSVLVFDDCDSVMQDATAANLLKGALDSNSERIISWNAETIRGMEDDLPRSFRFTGGVIFITNLHKEKIPQALRTRSVCVDVSMTTDEKIDRMKHILIEDEFMPEAHTSIKLLAIDIIEQFKNEAREVSMRSLIQVVRIGMKFSGEKFTNMARYALTN